LGSIDPLTGEVEEAPADPLEREQMRVTVLEEDLRLAEDEIRKLRRREAALQGELNRRIEKSSEGQAADLIARYYVERLKKGKTWVFGEKRRKAVVSRLKEGYDPRRICRAIDWIAEGAYVNPDTGQRYDDLELICRNEVNLDKYHDLAERNKTPSHFDAIWEEMFHPGTDVRRDML
jgi:hypothetical protein